MASPDGHEKRIRFGCGFVFGLLVGGIISARALYVNDFPILATCVITALVCAFLSLRYGEYFWRLMKKFSIWWI